MKRKSRKRPCRVCRKWFVPDPRVGDRQKTCGAKKCQTKWHAKKCAEWNQQNPAYFTEIYLAKKLAAIAESDSKDINFPVKSSQLPLKLVQEVIGAQYLVIIEYFTRLLFKSFQEVNLRQLPEINEELCRLPSEDISRGDSQQRAP